MPTLTDIQIHRSAPIPTWFGIGGAADRLARISTTDDLRRCLEIDPRIRILGDGANLLVADEGVGELVVSLNSGDFTNVHFDDANCRITAGAGANLPKIIVEAVRRGMAGLEGLGGIPASVGGAVVMNAGGNYGQIADVVHKVHAVDRAGVPITFSRNAIGFSYRHSGLNNIIITGVELKLKRDDPGKLRSKLREVMDFKKRSQPLGASSAGCIFKNPTLKHPIAHIGPAGARVSAGMLIDQAGCKGMTIGCATVSDRHGNFLTATKGGRAGDMLRLIDQVRDAVAQKFGVTLETEVVIWRRSQ